MSVMRYRLPSLHPGIELEQQGKASMSAGVACRIDVEWGRGRLFDQGAAQLFQQLVKEARMMRCTSISSKEERRQRPHGVATPLLMPCCRTMTVQDIQCHPSQMMHGVARDVHISCGLGTFPTS